MFELSSQAQIATSPAKLWRVLTDFPRYRTWTRVVLVDGEAVVGRPITYQITGYMRSGARRAIRFEGTVKSVSADRELIWTSGLPGLFHMRFGFELQPVQQATVVRHWIRISGLAAPLIRGPLSRL